MLLLLVLLLAPEPSEGPTPADPDEAAWSVFDSDAPEPSEGPAPTDPDEAAWSVFDSDAPEPTPPEPANTDALASEADDDEDDDKPKVGDILTGSLRLTGSFLHYPDEPALYPTGDDALLLTVARLLVDADLGKHVHLSINGFGELSRVPTGANLSGTFASAGSTDSAYRTKYLRWQFWDNGAAAGQLGVDRLTLRLHFDSLNVDIGRFPITYAVTGMFTTNDFFAPFSATAVNRVYKPGVDAIRVSAGITETSSIDVMGVLGYDPQSGRPDWRRSAMFARASIVGAGVEWAALGGKVAQRWVGGGSLQAGLGPVDLRAEFHVGIPDAEGDGHDAGDRPIYGRVAGGPSMTFAWHNSSIAAEYMFASDGARSASGYVARAQGRYTDDLPYLGTHYVGLMGGMEIIPILRIGLTGLLNATDSSGLAGVSLVYSVADESDLILGVFVPWGKGLRAFDPGNGVIELGSEFGLAALTAYLEMRAYF